jgi:hypothetical protein
MNTNNATEEYVKVYGEQWRKLIETALGFLDKNESGWGVTINRDSFLAGLIEEAKNSPAVPGPRG